MAMRVIDDTKLQDIAVAIQSKDNGGQMTVDEMVGRIEAIPTGTDFDMTVTDNHVKMNIEVNDYDLSFWTRFGISDGGTVTVDWGDGATDDYTGNQLLEYATQRKHTYSKAGRYLVAITIVNGVLTIGSVNNIAVLSEGSVTNYENLYDVVRIMYNYKVRELAFGANVLISNGINNMPFVKIYNDINFSLYAVSTDYIQIKSGTTAIGAQWFKDTSALTIKIPQSVSSIGNYAFDGCKVRIIDFTEIRLNENNELPFVVEGAATFRGSNSTILLFATQEIAEVAKVTTNLSPYTLRIKYVGEV